MTYVVCVNLHNVGGTYSLKQNPNDRFFRDFHDNFIYSYHFCQKYTEKNFIENLFNIYFVSDIWSLIHGFTSDKPTLSMLNYMSNIYEEIVY